MLKDKKKERVNIFQAIRDFRGEAIKTPVFVILEVFCEVLIPLLMAGIIDEGIMKGSMSYILTRGLLLTVLILVALYLGVRAGIHGARAGAGLAKNLRQDIFYRVQKFSFGNIDHFQASSLVTRMTTDINNIQMAYMLSLRLLARTPIMIILSLVMTLTINPRVALLFLIAIPFIGLVLVGLAKLAHPIFIRVFDMYDELNCVVQENVHAAREVKAYVRKEHENQKFAGISTKLFQLFSKAERLVAWNAPLMQLAIYCIILGILYLGSKDIVRGQMLVGQLTSVVVYAIQILTSLMLLSFVFIMNMISEASRDRVREVLEEEPEMQDRPKSLTEIADGSIDFENVYFSYGSEGDQPVLQQINLHIPSGATVGIFGGTGSSKSSLVQLIPRLYDVQQGVVKVGGVDVRNYNLASLRDAVSMVLQKNLLFTGSIYENVRWGNPQATDEEVQAVCREAQADSFIQDFPEGYNTLISQGGNNVSGGQKQRLCIARALLKKPRILILDDSTSAVDTKTDARIREALRRTLPDTTKIIISQRISSIEDADIILIMDEGRIVAQGSSEELLQTSPIYREVYELQNKGGEDHE